MITTGDKIPSFGLAADGKPANVPNGHMHVEMDASKVYFYDESNNTWYEDESGGGGGGGGGALVITANYSGASTGATPAEINAAATAGTPMYIKWGNTMRPAILATTDGGSNYLESHFVTMDTDMQTGNWTVFATRWRIQLLTSSLSQVYSSSERLALYTDIGGMAEG